MVSTWLRIIGPVRYDVPARSFRVECRMLKDGNSIQHFAVTEVSLTERGSAYLNTISSLYRKALASFQIGNGREKARIFNWGWQDRAQ